jgi:rRNA-processing protein FCF1
MQKMMLRVVLDTNFMMIPSQFKVDIFAEIRRLVNEPYELCIYQGSIDELLDLSKGNGNDASHAKTAMKLIKQKNLKTLPNSINRKYADSLILEGVTSKDVVCTQDQALKRLLKNKHKGIRLIALKSKKYLDFE